MAKHVSGRHHVISEQRKRGRADPGVLAFFEDAYADDQALYLSVVTLGELRRGVELRRFRGDLAVQRQYARNILTIDARIIAPWGHLRVPDGKTRSTN